MGRRRESRGGGDFMKERGVRRLFAVCPRSGHTANSLPCVFCSTHYRVLENLHTAKVQPFAVCVEGSCHSLHPWRTGSEFSDNTRRSSPCPQIPWMVKWAKTALFDTVGPDDLFMGPRLYLMTMSSPHHSRCAHFFPSFWAAQSHQAELPAKRQAVVL